MGETGVEFVLMGVTWIGGRGLDNVDWRKIEVKGPESNQPWTLPKVLDAKRNQALKVHLPHNLETKRALVRRGAGG
jgi:hypothetical protein